MEIIGHRKILDFLKKSLEKNKLAQAYLFIGPENIGKKTIALKFIKLIQCEKQKENLKKWPNFLCVCPSCQKIDKGFHPDIQIIEPPIKEKKGVIKEGEIGLEAIRQIQHQLSLSPYQSPYKIILLDKIEKITPEGANSLLKTLEEPPSFSILFLTTNSPEAVLPTIISRCQTIKFQPVSLKEIEEGLKKTGLSSENINFFIRQSQGRPGLVINYLKNSSLWKEEKEILNQLEKILKSDLNQRFQYIEKIYKDTFLAQQVLNCWLKWFRDLCLNLIKPELSLGLVENPKQFNYSLKKIKEIISEINQAQLLLANPSFNHRLILENLVLKM